MVSKAVDPLRGNSFFKTAAGMHRNPLGLIALFIISVYAIGALVVGFGNERFYGSPSHPVILFMAIFPVAVLIVFYLLVAHFHTHLYGPSDFIDQDNFFGRSAPKALKGLKTGAATSGAQIPVTESDISTLNAEYERMIDFGFILLHQTETLRPRTTPKSGLFKVRVWVEPIDQDNDLDEIESVTYRVWEDFPQSVIASSDQKSSFDLWLKIYGEFPVLAVVRKKNGETFQLMRHIDLPGRPLD
ncbi:pYEATS domain-containing protein [Pseudomonas beijingensis]|jgi:hypothetical protein|uniref:pYEATS domain-containing protein n=1 Tax=Pseudomonas beijingensis TaxID=2954101 RepID=UPI0027350053|nr:pYEATS domain-containing protein [Pseudomonas sp. FP2262]WLH44308.1 hypothetical protein PSH83_18170 [Pseudomonas sp. FP2262]